MEKQPISLYTSFFNVLDQGFDYQSALDNFTKFGEQCIVAVNTSKDKTLDAIKQWQSDNKDRNLKIIETDFSYNDPLCDGKIKNAALQACDNEWVTQIDGDERICLDLKERWVFYFNRLKESKFKVFLVPTLDLWGDVNSIRWDKQKGIHFKFYMHFKTGVYRGPVKQAKLPSGHINIKLSDGTETCDKDGNLLEAPFLVPEKFITKCSREEYLDFLRDEGVWIYHFGYVDFNKRIKRNDNFWRKMWETESGKPKEDLEEHESQLFHITYPHNLPMNFQ